MKFLKVLCVLAMVFAVSAVAYAETQSVKVSGDIAMRAFARDNYDLSKNDLDATDVAGGSSSQTNNWATFLQSTAEVQVEADLTDNVSGVVRLLNQRVWGDQNYTSNANSEIVTLGPIRDVTTVQTKTGGDAYNVDIDLAYIELKEFLYSPLTLKIGRQDLWFGKGFIIGNSLQDPENALYAPEYTAINSFDAIRATLDYDPWTIDAVYAKIGENLYRGDDDQDLMGVNIGYVFDQYNAEAEAYWWFRQDRNPASATTTVTANTRSIDNKINNDIHTIGGRGSFDPIENWTIALEGAYQAGQILGIAQQRDTRTRSAWAIDAMVECRYWQDDFAWKPVVGVEYIWYSGEKDAGNRVVTTNGNYTGWDHMYRGKFDTAIREFQNVFYATRQASTPSTTNQHQILIKGTLEPTDSLTFSATYGNFWLDKSYASDGPASNTKKYVGAEVDLELKWDYTEDVSFGLLSGWFFPGEHFTSNSDDIATDLVGTVKLSF